MTVGAMVPQTGLKGTGVLVPVIGPAGAGKDAMIAAAARTYARQPVVRFPPRIATWLGGPTENGPQLTTDEFSALESARAFAVTWRAYDRSYGVPSLIYDDLAVGSVVVVGVSRTVVGELRKRHPRVHVVYVTAKREYRERRLVERARGWPGYVASRLERGSDRQLPSPPVTVIDSSSSLTDAIDEFLGVLDTYVPAPSAGKPWFR